MEYKEFIERKYELKGNEENELTKYNLYLFIVNLIFKTKKENILDFSLKRTNIVNARRTFIFLLKTKLNLNYSEISRLVLTNSQTVQQNFINTQKIINKEIIYTDFLIDYEKVIKMVNMAN